MRAFIGAFVPDAIGVELSRVTEAWRDTSRGGRWTEDSHRHVTLAFLGELDDEASERAAGILRDIDASTPPVASLAGCSGLPNARRARVAVVELHAPQLVDLVEVLRDRLRAAAFRIEERPFRPHVTLGRFKTPAALTPVPDVLPLEWPITQLQLVESRSTDPAHRYVVHASLQLG